MKEEYNGPRYDKIRNISFEIQVRTIFMDAWANISHYLSYKNEADVPKNLKRDFQALSGLFYVADTHFELFFKESKRSQQNIHDRITTSLGDATKAIINEEINLDSLRAYLSSKFSERYCDADKSISMLINELYSVSISIISQLEEIYNLTWDIFILYEQEQLVNRKFTAVGTIRILLDLTNDEYRRKYNHYVIAEKNFIEMVDRKKTSKK
jgi:hypothetical protein